MNLTAEKAYEKEALDECRSGKSDALAVVFDFGGVLMNYSGMDKMCTRVSTKIGIPKNDFAKILLRKNSCNEVDHSHSLYRGTISAEEVEETVLKKHIESQYNIKLTEPIAAFSSWIGSDANIPYNECLIVAVKKLREHGYTTALLTNNFYIDKEKKLRRTPIDMSMFDVVVESALEGELKPEPRIYEITQERLGTNNIIFLDDLEENLNTARNLGWKTIHVTDPEKALQELEAAVGVTLK